MTFGGRPDLDENGDIPIIQNYGGVKGVSRTRFLFSSPSPLITTPAVQQCRLQLL